MPEYAFGSGFEEEENPEDRFVPGPPQATDVFESPIVETNRPPPRNLPTEDEIRQIVDMAPIMTEPEREEARWKVEAFYEAREKQEAKDRREIRQRNLLTDERKKEYYKTPEVIEAANGNGSPNDMYARYVTTDIIENDLLKRKLLPGEYEPMRNKLIGLEMAGQPEISDQGAFGVLKKREEVLKEGDVLNETIQSELFLAHAEAIDSQKPVQVGDVFEKVRGKHGDFVKGREAEVYKAIGDSQNRAAQIFEANKEAILYTVDWLTKANQEGEGIDEAKQMAQDALLDMPEADQQDAVRYAVALARTKILDKGGIKKNLEELALTVFSRMPGTVGIAGKYFEIDEKRGSVENGTARIANGQVIYDPTLKVEGARKLTPEEKSKAMLDLDREFKATNSIRILSGGYKAAFKADPLFSDKQWGGVPAYLERGTKGALENLPLMILSSYGWTGKAIYTTVVGSENYIRLLDENPGMDHRVARTAGYAMAAGESFLEAIKFDFLKGALTKGGLWRTLRDGGPTTYLKKFVGFNIAEAGVEGLQDFATSSTQKLIQTVAHDIDPNMNVGKIETWGQIATDWVDSRVEVQGQILVMGFIASGVGTYKHLKDPERALYNPETLKGYNLTDKEIRAVTGELDKTKRDALFSEIILNMPPEQIAEAQLYQQQKTLEAQDSQTSTDEVPKATLESSTTPEGEKVWHVLDENGNRIIENVPADVALRRQAEYQEQLDREQFQKRAQEGVAEQNVAADMEAEAVWEHLKPEDKTSAANILTFQHVEQPRNAEEVVAQQLLQKAVASHNKQRGTTGTPQADEVGLVSVDVPTTRAGLGAVNFIRWFEGTFGKRVQFVASKSGQPLSFVGLTDPSNPNTIFLDAAGNRNVLSLLGHEWSHTLEHSNPTLWKEMVGQMKPLVVDWAKQTGVIPQGYTASQATPEFVANVIGDAFSDPEFWATVRAQNPSMFEKILQAIMDWFDVITDRVSEYGTDAPGVISDLKKMREIIANAMNKSQAGPEAAAAPGEPVGAEASPRITKGADEWLSKQALSQEQSDQAKIRAKEIARADRRGVPNTQDLQQAVSEMVKGQAQASLRKFEGRGERETDGQGGYVKPEEETKVAEVINKFLDAEGVKGSTRQRRFEEAKEMIHADIMSTRARNPDKPTDAVKSPWAEIEVSGADIEFKDQKEGDPVLKATAAWVKQSYRFDEVPEGMTREAWAGELSRRVVSQFIERLQLGFHKDATDKQRQGAKLIVQELEWYREFTGKLRGEFGGAADFMADLLGAFSPRQNVQLNWRNAVDFIWGISSGKYDQLFEELDAYLKEDPAHTFKTWRAAGNPILRARSDALFGTNTELGHMAALGMWREIKFGDAPKAKNFTRNIIALSIKATIDVWAARLLNRVAEKPRLPVDAEQAVAGNHLTEAQAKKQFGLGPPWPEDIPVVGQFAFGQDVFEQVAAAMRDPATWAGTGVPQEVVTAFHNVTAADVQATNWFVEKEIWTDNNWTNEEGSGGSFMHEIEQMVGTRFQVGISQQVTGREDREDFLPQTPDQKAFADAVHADLAEAMPEAVSLRVKDTLGMYKQFRERSLDIEATLPPGLEPNDLMRVVLKHAAMKDQESVHISRIMEEDEDNPNARPGLEVYMKAGSDLSVFKPVLAMLARRGINGFTMVVDPRAKAGAEQFIGVRFQYIPEYSGDGKEWAKKGDRIRKTLLRAHEMILGLDGVASVMHANYDTVVFKKGIDYDVETVNSGAIGRGEAVAWRRAYFDAVAAKAARRYARDPIESKPDILNRERVVPEEPAGTTGATPEPVTITAFDPALMSFAEREITPTKDLERMLRKEAGVYEKLIKCLQ